MGWGKWVDGVSEGGVKMWSTRVRTRDLQASQTDARPGSRCTFIPSAPHTCPGDAVCVLRPSLCTHRLEGLKDVDVAEEEAE